MLLYFLIYSLCFDLLLFLLFILLPTFLIFFVGLLLCPCFSLFLLILCACCTYNRGARGAFRRPPLAASQQPENPCGIPVHDESVSYAVFWIFIWCEISFFRLQSFRLWCFLNGASWRKISLRSSCICSSWCFSVALIWWKFSFAGHCLLALMSFSQACHPLRFPPSRFITL